MTDIEDFRNAAKERLANPLVFSVFVSFCLWNWRMLAHLFLGDGNVDDRLAAISRLQDTGQRWLTIPLVAGFVFVLAMPPLLNLLDWLRDISLRQMRFRAATADWRNQLAVDLAKRTVKLGDLAKAIYGENVLGSIHAGMSELQKKLQKSVNDSDSERRMKHADELEHWCRAIAHIKDGTVDNQAGVESRRLIQLARHPISSLPSNIWLWLTTRRTKT